LDLFGFQRMKESNLVKEIMLALSQAGCIVWRNETSQAGCIVWRNETAGAWAGQKVMSQEGIVALKDARFIRAGLCKGSSDIIGIQKETGRFLAFEVKTKKGRPTEEQERFVRAVNKSGGIAGIVRSAEEALKLLEGL
jgi:hypothetical protein